MATFMKNIDIVSHSATIFRDYKFEGSDFCGYQSKYIIEICKVPGTTQEQMAKKLYIHKSNVARSVKDLEEGGYVEKCRKEGDKRAYRLYPTDKLSKAYPMVSAAHAEWRERLTEDFTEEEKAELLRLTQKLADKAEQIIASIQGKSDE